MSEHTGCPSISILLYLGVGACPGHYSNILNLADQLDSLEDIALAREMVSKVMSFLPAD